MNLYWHRKIIDCVFKPNLPMSGLTFGPINTGHYVCMYEVSCFFTCTCSPVYLPWCQMFENLLKLLHVDLGMQYIWRIRVVMSPFCIWYSKPLPNKEVSIACRKFPVACTMPLSVLKLKFFVAWSENNTINFIVNKDSPTVYLWII